MKRYQFNKIHILIFGMVLLFFSCEEEATGPTGEPTGDFTFEVDAENTQIINFTSTVEHAWAVLWDFGDNNTQVADSPSHFYSDPGSYTVTLKVYGADGTTPEVVSKEVEVIETLFDGGLLQQSEWQIMHVTGGNTAIVSERNGFEVKGSGITGETAEADWQNVMVWQAVDVEAGKSYQFDAYLTANGSDNTWTQIYFGSSEPVDGSDYSDNKVYGVSSWGTSGSCIGDPIVFTSILDARCEGQSGPDDGVFTFETSQTIYIVIKAGSQTGLHDIAWKNIEFMEM